MKTRVYYFDQADWRVTYYMPYGGYLMVKCPTWREAMDEACDIEEQKGWL